VSDDIFDRALDRRDAVIQEQRLRIKALEEALGALANAADNVGIAFFDSDDMPAEAEAMQAATLDAY
jgi:hypothetical protein